MANLLSALRLALAPPFAYLVLRGHPLAAPLFALAVLSDLLDGPLARRSGSDSAFGRALDHGADFAFVSLGLLAAAWRGAVPLALPAAIALAFAQYALDSHFVHREAGLRTSRLGRWNGILYFVPLGGVCLGLLGIAGLERAVRACAWALVASTALSIGDRLLTRRPARTAPSGRAAGRAGRSPR
jgi:CDP-diacylglycerol---glycerol-3-phosphate 3-phosphatidyltransferase